MIMKCTSCGVTYDSAYGHYNCITQAPNGPLEKDREPRKANKVPIQPLDVIDSWNLTYNLGTAVDRIGRFALGGDPEHLENAINALVREMNRVTGGHR